MVDLKKYLTKNKRKLIIIKRKNVSSEISKNNKIKAENIADEVKKSDSGVQKCELHPPAISLPSSSYTAITPPPQSQTCSKMQNSGLDSIPSPNTPLPSMVMVSALMALRTIFDSVTADPKKWPRIVFFAVQTRSFKGTIWKFGCTLDIDAFKKFAQNEAKREIRQEENGERHIIATCRTEPCTLTDTLEYINPRDKFLSKIKEISEKEILKLVVRTRKLSSELVDSKVLDLIFRVVGEYAGAHVPESITEAAYIMQAAQVCYDEETRKEKPRSAWKENIEKKARKQEKLSTSETKCLKKIMREFNLNLSSVTDLSEALIKKNESLNVSRIKLRCMKVGSNSEKRIVSLTFFEIDSIEDYPIFGQQCGTKMMTRSHNHPNTFPSLDEFVNIINWLPNWKAAGIDGIYNFFIEKLTTLHKYIYDIVKVICLEGTPQADWFYCGLTYLIPKGTPKTGSDYRPITCMSNLYKLTTKCVTKVVQVEVERRGLLSDNQLGAVRGVQGAKEQALLNVAINKDLDSIDHAYLTQCIENLNLPDWILKFIKVIISKWKIDISVRPEKIMSKKIDRGILQGDSLSPLLFVLCIDPLSQKQCEKYTKVTTHAPLRNIRKILAYFDHIRHGHVKQQAEMFFKEPIVLNIIVQV
ncbi:reverse transcriptase [Hamiltosporidium tvaerminnensis]|uniref:Reverse transcriptase n=1 Tax=Hamiltosporidium tvaerminnensis TaxID=1176355 RepID=A0A4Q9M146_9MICR|nr:reverse transcriptase [Hamiltosporidium tvaerminnensis]